MWSCRDASYIQGQTLGLPTFFLSHTERNNLITVDASDDVADDFQRKGGIRVFERRKRNWDLSGTRESFKKEHSTHGINWGRDQWNENNISIEPIDDRELESGWEEVAEESGMEPESKNFRQHPPIGQPGLAFSDRQNAKIASFRQPDPFYPGLQKRPDFYEQHKKLTVYVEKELLETIETLKKGRYIPSYSWLVTEAIRHYLQEMGARK